MVIHAEDLSQTYPNSRYAPQAREVLAKLRPDLLEKYPGPRPESRKRPRRNRAEQPDEESSGRSTIETTQ